jgi:hypothetical protein
MKKNRLIVWVLLLCFSGLYAQEDENVPEIPFIQLNGNLQLGIPLESFKNNLPNPGFGFGGLVAIRLKDLPFYPGLDISGVSYDSESTFFSLWVDGFLTDVELETTSNILFLHGMLRIKPDVNFFVQPYFDGLIGYKVLYTRTKLVDLLADEDRVLESETNQSDWAFSYGGAIGVQIDLSRRKNSYLDLRCAYLPGASAQYLVRREDTGQVFDEPIEAFEEKSSPTAVLLPQIGVTFEFWKFTE